jgi:hypothetical protein
LHEMVSNFAPQWINGFHFASFFFQIIQNCINETVTISINRCRIKPLLFKTLSNLAVWYFNSTLYLHGLDCWWGRFGTS